MGFNFLVRILNDKRMVSSTETDFEGIKLFDVLEFAVWMLRVPNYSNAELESCVG